MKRTDFVKVINYIGIEKYVCIIVTTRDFTPNGLLIAYIYDCSRKHGTSIPSIFFALEKHTHPLERSAKEVQKKCERVGYRAHQYKFGK